MAFGWSGVGLSGGEDGGCIRPFPPCVCDQGCASETWDVEDDVGRMVEILKIVFASYHERCVGVTECRDT